MSEQETKTTFMRAKEIVMWVLIGVGITALLIVSVGIYKGYRVVNDNEYEYVEKIKQQQHEQTEKSLEEMSGLLSGK